MKFHKDKITPCHPILEAIATGDALGLPYEGTKPEKVSWGFIGEWGITSDDTQQALIALRALRESGKQPKKFRALLAEYIAQWFCCLSPSIGLGTLKSSIKLCAGLEAPHSGSSSEGNGPLPRAAILGWELAEDAQLREFIEISTTTTHNSTKAVNAAYTLAKTMSALKKNPQLSRAHLFQLWTESNGDRAWQEMLESMEKAKHLNELLALTKQEHGIKGHSYPTLASALWAAQHHRNNLTEALIEVVHAGGDTDSAAAITGALCAAMGGTVSASWANIIDWPVTQEPSWKRVGFNMLTMAGIFGYHLPKRILRI